MNEAMEADMEARAKTAVLAMDGLVELLENQVQGWTPSADMMAALLKGVFAQAKSAMPKYQGSYHGPRSNDD